MGVTFQLESYPELGVDEFIDVLESPDTRGTTAR